MTVREMKHAALAEQWTANIIDCRQRGLSVAAWCEEHQVNKSTYYKWERRLLTEVGPREKQTNRELSASELPVPAFVELAAPSQALPAVEAPGIAAGFMPDAVLRKGSVTIEVSNSASPQLLGFLKGVIDHAD